MSPAADFEAELVDGRTRSRGYPTDFATDGLHLNCLAQTSTLVVCDLPGPGISARLALRPGENSSVEALLFGQIEALYDPVSVTQ